VRSFPLTVLNGGINRLRVKGGASASQLYDLQNAYITNAGSIAPREGTIRAATLDSSTVGLSAENGNFNIFSSAFSTAALPPNYVLNVLSNPNNTSSTPVTILFAKPFMGFPYVVASFSDGSIHNYWLQNNGTWTSTTDYTSASIVLPPVANGLAYQGVRDFPPQPLWTADTQITSGTYVEPNTATGFAYQAIAVAGTPVHTGLVEPVWPTVAGGVLQEFGDFDVSSTDVGTTQGNSPFTTASPLGTNITDRYGDSATIANSGVFTSSAATLSSSTLASTKVNTWQAGTNYAPGAVVVPTTNQGAFVNAIPNGDFEGGSGAGGWTFTNVGGSAAWAYSTFAPYQGSEGLIVGGGSFGTLGARATMTSYSLVTPGQSVTASAYLNPNNSGANLTMDIILRWYDSTDSFISESGFHQNDQGGFGYRKVSITATAPANAAHVRVALAAGSGGGSPNNGFADLVTWNLQTPSPVTNFLFEAVQPTAASSAATEPVWPTILGNTVIDGGVTWKAIGTSIITWQAIPLMQSGLNAPVFPTTIGVSVFDSSTYQNQNGFITTLTGMSWIATDRHVIDTGCPNTAAVTIGASHIFEGSNDIVSYSAAVNPIDWSSTNNAGYLPTGLNNYGDNPVAVLALYRGNLIVFNAGGYQMWQIDPDPQNMALLDAQPVGSIYTRAAQSVANDLLFLTEVGVRNLGTLGATANMAIGNTGQQVDPLVVAQLTGTPIYPNPGAGDAFFSSVSLLLHCDGTSGSTLFVDSSLNNFTMTAGGSAQINTVNPKFGTGNFAALNTATGTGFLTGPAVAPGGPLDFGTGNFTLEGWLLVPSAFGGGTSIFPAGILGSSAANWELITVATSPAAATSAGPFPGFSLEFACNGGTTPTPAFSVATTLSLNTWHYFTVVRNGTSITTYLDGVGGTPSAILATTAITAPATLFVGSVSEFQSIELDEIRITKGIARYTANFTPPTAPFSTVPVYTPLSLYYPGRGQYWLIFGPQAFVLTVNGTGTKSWSRYIFPDVITDWTLNAGILYLRTAGNLVWQLDRNTVGIDDSSATLTTQGANVPFNGVVQWPYLDLASLGINKMLVGIDVVGTGNCNIQVAFNQNDLSSFNDNPVFSSSPSVTTPYFVQIDDTLPGEPLPIPINAASYSPILTFVGSSTSANAWTWQAMNIYFSPAPSSAGGATG
jgi:Concanavalin A-like lectin/glucanases superfamily